MSVNKVKSLKNLIFRHEVAISFLVAVTGLLGGASAYFWQQNSTESVRINTMFYVTEQIRSDLYAQIQETIRARVLRDPNAFEAYPKYSRSISERFNQLRQQSLSREEDYAIQDLNLAYRKIQGDMNRLFISPYADNDSARIQMLNPGFAQQMVGNFEDYYSAFKQLLFKQHGKLDETLALWTKFAPFVIPIPLIIAVLILIYTRYIMHKEFIKPIANVIRGANEISQGHLEHHIDDKHMAVAEVFNLTSSVNKMAKDLARNRDTLLENERQVTLGSLIPVVAHNIRNPLASIRATAQLLEHADNEADINEAKNSIIDATDRLGRWVSALVSYLHPLKPKFRTIQAPVLMDAALVLLNNKIAEKNINIIKQGWDITTTLSVDPDLMEQAFYSLLANAIDATPNGKTITINIKALTDKLEFKITDSGPGLPFDPKPGSLEPGPSTKRFGTGLGIPIAFKICQKHGWELTFNNLAGQGAETIIWAPLQQ